MHREDPADRFHSAHDLGIALEAVSGTSSRSAASIVPLPAARRSKLLAMGIAAGAVAAVLAAFAIGRAMSPAPPNTDAPVPASHVQTRSLLLGAARAGRRNDRLLGTLGSPLRQLFSIAAESPDSLQLPYHRADVVAISSKNELAIVSNRKQVRVYAQPGTLARASLSGGASRDLLEDVQDADWLPDGSNLAVSHFVNGRYRLEFPIERCVPNERLDQQPPGLAGRTICSVSRSSNHGRRSRVRGGRRRLRRGAADFPRL